MEIKINDYYEPEHFRAICEDNFNVSRTCEYEKNEMHHIHDSCEILLVEDGVVDYFIAGEKFHLAANDILVIGSKHHHMRRIEKLPFLRYGLTLKPTYYKSLFVDQDMWKVFLTPNQDNYVKYYKNVDKEIFQKLIRLFNVLYVEETNKQSFNSLMQGSIITEISILLFRIFNIVRTNEAITPMRKIMMEIKEFIDNHYFENLNLTVLSNQFYLHPSTISKEFNKYSNYSLNDYINTVRICVAARLLECTQESVTEISVKCGYLNVNTFLRQFKDKMKLSPLQYRKSMMRIYSQFEVYPKK